MADEKAFLTTTEAARLLEVDRRTVHRWIRLGQLPAMRLPSGVYKIRREVIEELLREGRPDQ